MSWLGHRDFLYCPPNAVSRLEKLPFYDFLGEHRHDDLPHAFLGVRLEPADTPLWTFEEMSGTMDSTVRHCSIRSPFWNTLCFRLKLGRVVMWEINNGWLDNECISNLVATSNLVWKYLKAEHEKCVKASFG